MSTHKALLIIGLGAIFTTAASAGAPMGPPMALMGEGNWGAGAQYGHANMDLEADGTLEAVYTTGGPTLELRESVDVDDLAMNMFFGTVAYGVGDTWDLFVRLGVADAQDDLTAKDVALVTSVAGDPDIAQQYSIGKYDGNLGFAGGIGTRATLYRSGPWAFGGLAQVTWFFPGDSDVRYTDPIWGDDAVQTGQVSIEFWEAQVSLAAIYEIDTLRLWAGPFLQFIDGDLDRDGSTSAGDFRGEFCGSADLEEKSELGGHVGVDWEASSEVHVWVEGQLTGDSWFFGAGLMFHPEQTFGM
jgi:hypothetical protein